MFIFIHAAQNTERLDDCSSAIQPVMAELQHTAGLTDVKALALWMHSADPFTVLISVIYMVF